MKTSKPFSTISYNTTNHLIVKLEELAKRQVINFYAFIEHLPEEDEKKAHKHLYIVPNGLYQTDALKPYLDEIDPVDPSLPPLSILPCQSSKFCDWYLYALHDKGYLALKNSARKYHYLKDDFITSSEEYFTELIHTSDFSKTERLKTFIEQTDKGVQLGDMVRQGLIPMANFNQYERLYGLLHYENALRITPTHTPKTNPEPDEDDK